MGGEPGKESSLHQTHADVKQLYRRPSNRAQGRRVVSVISAGLRATLLSAAAVQCAFRPQGLRSEW